MSYKITIENIFGILDSRTVPFREDIQPVALKMMEQMAYLSPGDRLHVAEVDILTGIIGPTRRRR